MDSFQVIYHIKKITKQYLTNLHNEGVLTKNETSQCSRSYVFFGNNIYFPSDSRIIVRGLVSFTTPDEFTNKFNEYFDVIFTSYIGSKKLTSSHSHDKISLSMKDRDPNIKDVYGTIVSMDSILTTFDYDSSDDEEMGINKKTQCTTSPFSIILDKDHLCINGPSIKDINVLYCSLMGYDYDEHMMNMHLRNINLYEELSGENITLHL